MPIRKRCFIAGCSRSGTTLLQRIISAHSEVHTFPETGIFLKAWGMRHTMPSAYLGITSNKEKKVLKRLIKDLPENKKLNLSRYSQGLLKNNTDHITATLDHLCLSKNCTIWLEKTPRHFLHAKRFSQKIDNCVVFHVIRDGLDVVASIVDRARKNPDKFAKQNIDYAIRLWNQAINKQLACVNQNNHYFIRYEELAAEPAKYAQMICETLELAFEQSMISKPVNQASFIKQSETWKAGICGDIKPASSKAVNLFSEAELQYIQTRLDCKKYRQLINQISKTQESYTGVLAHS